METVEAQRLTVEDYIKLLGDNTLGVKYDKGKPQWDLLPWKEMEDVVKVLTFGASKYASDNWKNVPNSPSRYMDATMQKYTKDSPTVKFLGHIHSTISLLIP